MSYFSGRDGSLYVGAVQVARVQNWSVSSTVDTLEVTDLGDTARNYVPGLKAATGSATIFYYLDTPSALLSKVIKTGGTSESDIVSLSLRWGAKRLEFNAVINQGDITCSVGEVMQAQISFTVTGDMTTVTL